MKVEHAVIVVRQFKTAGLAFAAELFDIPDLPLFSTFRAKLVEAFFAQAHDPVLVAGLCIKLGDRFLLKAG